MPITKLRPSFTFTPDRLEQLKRLVPEAFADGMVNWEVLREAMGEYIEDEGPAAEHFGLFWPGKRDARRLAAMPSKGTLVPVPGEGVNEETTHNVFIEGDNLEVLKILLKSYSGRVKMIYIDPPYNTGNDLIYMDSFAEPLEEYLRRTAQADDTGSLLTTNTKADGRYHSNWLSMMYPRLILARQLLSADGVLYASADDHEVHNLRLLLDEVFGQGAFVADVVVVNNLKGRSDRRYIATAHERLLMYTREEFEEEGLELPEERVSEFNMQDEVGRYRLLGLRKRGGADTRAKRPKLYFPLYVDPASGTVSLEPNEGKSIEVLPRKSDGTDGCWRWGKEKVRLHLSTLVGRKVEGAEKHDVFEKDYLETDGVIRRIKPKSVMSGSNYSTDAATKAFRQMFPEAPFRNPKPVPFMRDLVSYSTVSMSRDIVLDFFAGSCTTAHAVFEANLEDGGDRQFLMVQLPEPTGDPAFTTVAEVGKERLRRALRGPLANSESDAVAGDYGFRVLRLDRTCFKPWKDYLGGEQEHLEDLFAGAEDPLVPGWREDALLTEVLLLEGFPLDARLVPMTGTGKNNVIRVEADDCAHRLFVCLDNKLFEEALSELTLGPEDVFVCLDAALSDHAKVNMGDICILHVI